MQKSKQKKEKEQAHSEKDPLLTKTDRTDTWSKLDNRQGIVVPYGIIRRERFYHWPPCKLLFHHLNILFLYSVHFLILNRKKTLIYQVRHLPKEKSSIFVSLVAKRVVRAKSTM